MKTAPQPGLFLFVVTTILWLTLDLLLLQKILNYEFC